MPIVCIEARAAHRALTQRRPKTDAGDAEGLARLAQVGWFTEIRVKSLASHEQRAPLLARERLDGLQRDLANQIRGLLKPFGLLVGQVAKGRFAAQVRALLEGRPALQAAIEPLLAAAAALAEQQEALDRAVARQARAHPACRRLVGAPGVGPVTALAFVSVIDDPTRFASSQAVGAYLGLTPRRWQSGEVDCQGAIPRCGDRLLRHLLYEAANSLIGRLKRPCAPQSWAARLQAKGGAKKARAALARKLAVLLHKLWVTEARFDWRQAPA